MGLCLKTSTGDLGLAWAPVAAGIYLPFFRPDGPEWAFCLRPGAGDLNLVRPERQQEPLIKQRGGEGREGKHFFSLLMQIYRTTHEYNYFVPSGLYFSLNMQGFPEA